jgi:hypothetical protein
MPSEELRARLQRRKEEPRAEALRTALREELATAEAFGYLPDSEIPEWVAVRFRAAVRVASVPDARIGEDAGEERVNRWIEEFARDHGVTGRVALRTGMTFFRWLDCRLPAEGWAGPVRARLGGDLVLLSSARDALVIIFEEEYDYLAFASGPPPE